VNAFQIHEWLHDTDLLKEDDVREIQIDGPLRKVYVKFVTSERMMNIMQHIQEDLSFHHENGEISQVKVEAAGLGIRRVRASTLPPEVTDSQIVNVMTTYGDIKKIQDEAWSHAIVSK
jgi:hypothetical protein